MILTRRFDGRENVENEHLRLEELKLESVAERFEKVGGWLGVLPDLASSVEFDPWQ